MNGFEPYETFQLLVETGGTQERGDALLLAACDAFAHRRWPPQPEIEQFEALARRLFPAASMEARAKAAAMLSQAETRTPGLEMLVIDNLGDKAEAYLASDVPLLADTVAEIVSRGDARLAAALACRHDLDADMVQKLFRMNSRRVYRALAGNESIVPRGAFQNALARAAQMDLEIATILAKRADFDTALLAPAFFDLGEAERLAIIKAFARRKTPPAPIKKTLEQLTVATDQLSRALMKLFTENRRPEVTRLLTQITGLDALRCGQIAHDVSGAALFVVLRAFGISDHDGLQVLIHATSHDTDRSKTLADFARLFHEVDAESMAFLLSAWRGDVDLLELAKPDYRPFTQASRRTPQHNVILSSGMDTARRGEALQHDRRQQAS